MKREKTLNELSLSKSKREGIMKKFPRAAAYVESHLVPRRYCNRCGYPVLKSDLEEYPYQCVHCDEDLYGIETYVKENNSEELNDDEYCKLVEQCADSSVVEEYQNELL